MKGLSLTLTIVVVAIALIVTVLVVVTVFNKQIVQFIGMLNPWSLEKTMENLCYDRCTTYCTVNVEESGTEWENLQITVQGDTKQCDDVMSGILGDAMGKCEC